MLAHGGPKGRLLWLLLYDETGENCKHQPTLEMPDENGVAKSCEYEYVFCGRNFLQHMSNCGSSGCILLVVYIIPPFHLSR